MSEAKMLKFKPEDFGNVYHSDMIRRLCEDAAETANKVFDQWVESLDVVRSTNSDCQRWWDRMDCGYEYTHKARILPPEEIERECEVTRSVGIEFP